jgi:hypothetical protein
MRNAFQETPEAILRGTDRVAHTCDRSCIELRPPPPSGASTTDICYDRIDRSQACSITAAFLDRDIEGSASKSWRNGFEASIPPAHDRRRP